MYSNLGRGEATLPYLGFRRPPYGLVAPAGTQKVDSTTKEHMTICRAVNVLSRKRRRPGRGLVCLEGIGLLG